MMGAESNRMKRKRNLIFALAEGLLGSQTAIIEKADREFAQALVNVDLTTIEDTLADTYTFTDPTGRVSTKKDVLDDLRNRAIKIKSHEISDVKVQVYDNAAIETGILTSKATRDGRDVSGTFRFTRVWVMRNGRWQTVALQETRSL
jgi:ketosteroid isomerase-like protein